MSYVHRITYGVVGHTFIWGHPFSDPLRRYGTSSPGRVPGRRVDLWGQRVFHVPMNERQQS
jgi:hypothetical protein